MVAAYLRGPAATVSVSAGQHPADKCGKERWATREDLAAAQLKKPHKRILEMKAYRCSHCGGWHVTSGKMHP